MHRSPDPAALQKLLSSLGLFGPGAGRTVVAGDVASFETAPAVAAVDARSGSAWWWALAGLAAGVMLTALAVRFLLAVRTRLSERMVADQPAVDDGLVRMTPLSG